MKIRTNLYLITAILLTSTFLTLCEGVNDIDHEPFSDHLDHLDHLDDFHDINNFDDSNVIHRVELVQHNGDSMTKYATTAHTNQETNNELFPNTIPIIQQSNVPTTFTKVVKQTVIKKSNNDGNNSPKIDLSMKDIYSNNKLKESVIGTVENNGLPSIPSQQASDLQSNIKNIIHTTVTKTTTSGSPSNELNESFNKIHNLNALPSNNIISTMSSENTKYNDRNAGSSSSQSNSMDENSKIKIISTTEDITNGNGFDNSKRISRKPGGSFRRTKTTILKQHNINDSNDRGDLGTSSIGFNREDTSSNNIVSSMTTPLGYNTVTTSTVDRDNNVFNNGIPSRIQQIRFNKLNQLGNSISETGAVQNPGSFVQTKTTIIKNGRAADEIKLDDLNDNKIDYNIGDGMSTSNDIVNSNYIISSDNNGNDKSSGYGYSYGYGYGNGMDSGNHNNDGNYNLISSNHLMDGASSGGYSSYIMSNGYSKGNGKRKKRRKNGSKKTFKGGSLKNVSYGKSQGNGQIRVKNGRNYKNTRSSKNRSGGNSQYYSSTNYVRGGQSKSFSSSASSSDESSMKKKKSCHCNKKRKLKKRDSSESNGSSEGHHGPGRPGSHDLGISMEIQPMQNNGDFIAGVPPQLPPSMGPEPQPNLLFDMMQEQGPDQSLNYSQSDITTVLNRQGEMGSQLINDHQLPNTDISNQYLTYQIPNTGSLYKSDSQQEQYFGSPRLGPGPGPHQGHGPGPHPGHGPGPHPGHGPGPHSGHGPGPHPGHGPGPHPGHGPGPHSGNGPGPHSGPHPGHGPRPRPPPRPWHGPGPQANPFDSRPFIGGEYPKLFEQNLQPPPLQQFPYPYSFISNMGSTTPVFTDIQSGQGDQININTDLPQIQQDIEGTGFNRMDALNSGSMTTSTRSNMIRNTGGGPIMQYFKTIKTTGNIDGNGPLDMQMVQTQSVPPEVDSYGIQSVLDLVQTAMELVLQILPGYTNTFESGINA
ncbi:unnamed protein product [Macrosiphum euphorbiae]|uniref:Uncharacterized protein n=1 Tax=Macrosiphum euphorbiae TaxID=13131 RepID=A0AAV0XIG7_9HEMI|nr:unnamed protein product [Macrosiphum euphorbiae]